MKFIQTKVIDELFLIFFINYFIIICLFNLDFFYIIYDILFQKFYLNLIVLTNLIFFFVIPKKKRKIKKKVKTPIQQLIDICKVAAFRMKVKKLLMKLYNIEDEPKKKW